jgi:hypothetical protein
VSAKATRKRELETRAYKVRCARCAALPGEPCRTDNGEPAKSMHRERIREAGYLPIVSEPPR